MAHIQLGSFQVTAQRGYDQLYFKIGRLSFFIEKTGYKPKSGFLEIWREFEDKSPAHYFIFGKRIWWELEPEPVLYSC